MRIAWLITSLRHLRTERAPTLALALVVLVTSVVAGLAPRLVDSISDESLQQAVADAPIAEANLQLIEDGRIRAGGVQPLARVAEEGLEREGMMAGGIRSLIAERSEIVLSPRWSILTPTRTPSTVRFRLQPGARERINLVDGRLPADAATTATRTQPGATEPVEILVFEGIMATETLDALQVAVGDTLLLEPDGRDQLFFSSDTDRQAELVIVGAFEPVAPVDRYWLGDSTLWEPTLRALSSDVQFLDTHVLVADGLYGDLLRESDAAGWSLRYTWRYAVDPRRLDAASEDSLIADFRRLESTFRPQTSFSGEASGTIIRSSLLRILETHRSQWSSAAGVLGVAAIGPALVAAIALGLMGALVAVRRRAILAVARSRGASLGQVSAAAILEGFIVVAIPVIVAVTIAIWVRPAGPRAPTLDAVAVVAAAAVLVLVAAILREARAPLRPAGRVADPIRPPGARRIAAEGLAVGMAVLGVYLLRERGVSGAGGAGQVGASDPFVAAVPALAGLAAGLVAVRLVPVPTALLGRLAARRRDLVPVLAIRRATRERDTGPVLIVLLAATTVGAFSLATIAHLDRAAEAVSWHEVGAPFRLAAGSRTLPPSLDAASVSGVTGVAGATQTQGTTSASASRFDVLAIDLRAYQALIADTRGEVPLPPEMLAEAATPYPAIVSTRLSGIRDGPQPGDTFRLTIEGLTGEFRAIDVRDVFPTLPAGGRFVVVAREHVQAIDPDARLRTSSLFIAADDGAAEGLRSALLPAAPASSLLSRAEREAAIEGSPMVSAVAAGTAVAALVAAAYAALSVTATLALSGAARAVETVHLRTIGLGRRQVVGLLVAEHGPATLFAFLVGTALGFAIFQLVGARIGLTTVVGSELDIPFAVGAGHIATLLIVVVTVASLGLALATAIQGRAGAASATRRGIE